jgi:type I restriction enzyme M protein
LGKTYPLNEGDLAEFIDLQKTKADSANSWSVSIADVDVATYDLSVKNPHKTEKTDLRDPSAIINQIQEFDKESAEILNKIRELL